MTASRRTFLGTVAAAPAAAGRPRPWSPNDHIGIGLIGNGSRGRFHLSDLQKVKAENIAITGVCDVHRPARETMAERAGTAFGAAVKKTADYRELLG